MINAQPRRPRPLVLIALDAARGHAWTALEQRYARHTLTLDASDRIDAEAIVHNQVARGLVRKAKEMGGRLHLIGLVSDAGVHASLEHLSALIELAKRMSVRVVVHAILDGVDVAPYSAARYVRELEEQLDPGVGRIGTISGRAYAMDSEARWDRIEKVYQAFVADGVRRVDSALRGIQDSCGIGTTEGLVEPFVVFDYPGVSLVDVAIHFNFGAERARELSRALADPQFERFTRKGGRAPFAGRFACMTPCVSGLGLPTLFARAPDPMSLPLEVLASAKYKQFHCSDGDAATIGKTAEAAIRSGSYDFVLADLASPDNSASIGPVAQLSEAVGGIVEAARSVGGATLVLGGRDAGDTVPLVYIDAAGTPARLRAHGQFRDLGVTLLDLLQLPRPDDLEGESLLAR